MFANTIGITFLIILILVGIGLWCIWEIIYPQKKFSQSVFAKLRNYNFSNKLFWIKHTALLLSFIFLVLAIFRPQWGIKKTSIKAEGIDVIFTLDVSQSMKAQDLSQGRRNFSRLAGAKHMINNFVQNKENNRFGLIIFAGEAFVSTPLTFDHPAFLTFLEGVDFNDVSKQGTNLSEAIKASLDRFVKQNEEEKRGKAIILISDGGEELDEKTKKYADIAREDGIPILTVGIGSQKGAPIPERIDVFGSISYKTHKGRKVFTKLNEEPLKTIAEITDGKYFHAEKVQDLEQIAKELDKLQKTTLDKEVGGMKEDRYQYFLFPAFLFFVVFLFCPKRKINISKFLQKNF